MESTRGECERRIGEIKSSVGRMCKLTEVFWESVPKSWCSVGKGAVAQNFKEDETGWRYKERYDDEQVDPGGWMVRSWRM